MSAVAAVDFIAPSIRLEQLAAGGAQTAPQPSVSFETWLQNQVSELNTTLHASDAMVAQLAAGKTDNLHQVMIGMEEAKLSFQLALQVRNRILEAYQDVARMQV
jgi:flagellar hook-basal body complex protein FliE